MLGILDTGQQMTDAVIKPLPASVSPICRVVRCSSRVPSCCSSRLIRLETTAGEMPSDLAAADMLPLAATLTKISRSPRLVITRFFPHWNK